MLQCNVLNRECCFLIVESIYTAVAINHPVPYSISVWATPPSHQHHHCPCQSYIATITNYNSEPCFPNTKPANTCNPMLVHNFPSNTYNERTRRNKCEMFLFLFCSVSKRIRVCFLYEENGRIRTTREAHGCSVHAMWRGEWRARAGSENVR